MNAVAGAPTPDDERAATGTGLCSVGPAADHGAGPVAEHKSPVPPGSFRPDPGADFTQPRARGSEGFTQAAWPVAAVLLVPGVAALAYALFRDAVAMMTGGLVTLLLVLLVDHYVD